MLQLKLKQKGELRIIAHISGGRARKKPASVVDYITGVGQGDVSAKSLVETSPRPVGFMLHALRELDSTA